MDLQLKGKTALVTGASIGIGRGIAKALGREGVRLALMAHHYRADWEWHDDDLRRAEKRLAAWRAQLAGYRCIYTPNAVVYHHLAATGGGVTASFYDGRNTIWILIKDYPADLWRKHWRKILRAQWSLAWEALRAWRGAAARARLRGMAAALVGVPKMLPKRRAIQQGRRVSIAYLESILTPVPPGDDPRQ